MQPVVKPDRFLENRDKFVMRNIRYIIPVLFKTVFAEDATNTTVKANRHGGVCSANTMYHARKRNIIIAAEFGIVE